jgi:hypothetical protein
LCAAVRIAELKILSAGHLLTVSGSVRRVDQKALAALRTALEPSKVRVRRFERGAD